MGAAVTILAVIAFVYLILYFLQKKSQVTSSFLFKGKTISYVDVGAGFPVFYFLGFESSHMDSILFSSDSLPIRLIIINRPGYAGSDYFSVSCVDWARIVEQLADNLCIKHFGVAGVSSGGVFAMTVACVLQERVQGLLLLSPPSICSLNTSYTRKKLPVLMKIQLIAYILLNRFYLFYNIQKYEECTFQRLKAEPDIQAICKLPKHYRYCGQLEAMKTLSSVLASYNDLLYFLGEKPLQLEKTKIPAMIWYGKEDKITEANNVRVYDLFFSVSQEFALNNEGHISYLWRDWTKIWDGFAKFLKLNSSFPLV